MSNKLVDIRQKINELKEQRISLKSDISKCEKDILILQKKCLHTNNKKTSLGEVERRYNLEDVAERRTIIERRITCLDCDYSWNEQKYDEEDELWAFDQGDFPKP
jgi:chromosome segregation ATPase